MPGSGSFICTPDGWIGQLNCSSLHSLICMQSHTSERSSRFLVVSCTPYAIQNGAIECTGSDYASMCTVKSCLPGYSVAFNGSNTTTCNEFGQWSDRAECTGFTSGHYPSLKIIDSQIRMHASFQTVSRTHLIATTTRHQWEAKSMIQLQMKDLNADARNTSSETPALLALAVVCQY